jgi:hypothetical protein
MPLDPPAMLVQMAVLPEMIISGTLAVPLVTVPMLPLPCMECYFQLKKKKKRLAT